MQTITETARAFFEPCESGKGSSVCRIGCTPDVSFAAQAEPLAEVRTLEQSTERMKALMAVLTDAT